MSVKLDALKYLYQLMYTFKVNLLLFFYKEHYVQKI